MTSEASDIVTADTFGIQLCELMGLDHRTINSITIELVADTIGKIKIVKSSTANIMNFGGWPEFIKTAEIECIEDGKPVEMESIQ